MFNNTAIPTVGQYTARNYLTGILLLFLCILLASCSAPVKKKKRDGAPNYYVDETKIPNAVPKTEPLSKYGNMTSYRVFGKRYYTLKTSKHYDEIGVASWYGTQFHNRRTSSGEPYNMLAMTAAHKSLPLPTYVEVTNLSNNRKIIVKVNDRGPFESSRIIDLSYVAAKKLDVVRTGTAKVRVRAINTHKAPDKTTMFAKNSKQQPSIYKLPGATRQTMYLQVGAFRNKTNAERFKRQLSSMLNTPHVTVLKPNAKHPFYRVHVGPIKDVATVNRITSRLKSAGIKTIVAV
jgi:rare lipoprotein A